jgi:Fe-S cluster biogenesis protein NfuA/nitrite reductase/ring-hydroxylating ferredoxin subunit
MLEAQETQENLDINQIAHRLDELVQLFEQHPDVTTRDRALELLALVDALHRTGLERLVAALPPENYTALLHDSAAQTLLTLYDLIPLDPLGEAEAALDTVRPYLHAHGGAVEILKVEDGRVHLRLSGSCNGCAASANTLKGLIETALRENFGAFQDIEVHEPAPASGKRFLPMASAATRNAQPLTLNRPVFTSVGTLEDLPGGTLKGVEIGETRALLCSVAGEVYAYHNACPGSLLPLDGARLEGMHILCPWHGCVFDARNGKRLAGGALEGLAVIPVSVRESEIRLALNVAPVALGASHG